VVALAVQALQQPMLRLQAASAPACTATQALLERQAEATAAPRQSQRPAATVAVAVVAAVPQWQPTAVTAGLVRYLAAAAVAVARPRQAREVATVGPVLAARSP
jgi:hypothetical protein